MQSHYLTADILHLCDERTVCGVVKTLKVARDDLKREGTRQMTGSEPEVVGSVR